GPAHRDLTGPGRQSQDRAGERDTGRVDGGPRASDAERESFVAALQRHFADGRLTPEEFAERVDRVLAARSLSELYALTADLP
ncbi:MAG TPA: hypothetical protein DCQ30_10675, partial [Acidimicrobiaceae bacterium]|nr:hypothetical protein [Acidimicrobiaceae bacterium]